MTPIQQAIEACECALNCNGHAMCGMLISKALAALRSIPEALPECEAAKDAERYRWLRDKCTPEDAPQHTWIVEAHSSEWDAAIDAARQPCGE